MERNLPAVCWHKWFSPGPYERGNNNEGIPLEPVRFEIESLHAGVFWFGADSILEFPAPIFGSYEAWNLDRSICVDRYSRYAAYGYAEEGKKAQWEDVNWATLQQDCLQRNADRYQHSNIREKTWTLHREQDKGTDEHRLSGEKTETDRNNTAIFNPRTAVVLRTWLDMEYTEDDLYYIRSIIMELSLLSGAEYEVILLVDAKNAELPYPTDKAGLDSLKKSLPLELQDLAVFFNSKMLEDWYPKINVHQ